MRWLLLITIILTTWPQSGSVCSAADNVTAESLFGKWKLKSLVINDGEWFVATAGWGTVGRTWEFREDGTGDFGTTKTKWELNSDEGTLKVSVLNYWGSWTTPCPSGAIEFDGEDLILEFLDPLKQKNVMTLSPIKSAKKRSSKKADEVNGIVSIEKKIFDREVFTETIETLPGLPKKFTVQREFQTAITAVVTTGTEVHGEVKLGNSAIATIAAGVKAKIEASLGVTIGKKDTVSETYELDGKQHVKMNIKWIERYRKGAITMPDGSKEEFEVCVGLRTIPEKAD